MDMFAAVCEDGLAVRLSSIDVLVRRLSVIDEKAKSKCIVLWFNELAYEVKSILLLIVYLKGHSRAPLFPH